MARWLVVVACVCAVAAPARADDPDDGWTGQWVWPRAADLDVRDEDGKSIFKLSGNAQVLWAGKEWVLVRHKSYPGPYEGYVEKKNVVRLADAPQHFTDLIRTNPNDRRAYACRAQAWTRKGEHENAIKDLTEAIRLEPAAWLYNARGNGWSARGEPDKAIADYTEAIRLDPKYVVAVHNRGNQWRRKKDYEVALKDFDEALRLDPKHASSYDERGQVWEAKGEYVKALDDYAEASRHDPKDPALTNQRAWLLATCPDTKFRDGPRAVELATKACELTVWKAGGAIDTLAAAYAAVGEFERAVKYQKQAIELDKPNEKEYRERLALYEAKKPYRQEPVKK